MENMQILGDVIKFRWFQMSFVPIVTASEI